MEGRRRFVVPVLDQAEREKLARLILSLRTKGCDDRAILGAIETVPRRLFVMAEDQHRSLDDRPLPIECGQTLSPPSLIARMIAALGPWPADKVLDIGTGSGFAAAILSRLAAKVHTVERYRMLVELAEERLAALRYGNVTVHQADGAEGHPEGGPYDRILVSASVEAVPPALLDQMKPGGVMVVPIGRSGEMQALTRITRPAAGRDYPAETIGQVRMVALVPGRAQHL